jgi:hypothetical protein
MPAHPVSKEVAQATIDAIEDALRKGHKPYGAFLGRHEVGCIKAAADALGTGHSVVSNRLKTMKRLYNMEPDWTVYKEGEARTAPHDQREMFKLREENTRLRRNLAELQRGELDAEAIREIIGGITASPADPPNWLLRETKTGKAKHVPMTIWSDWHCGEVVSRYETNNQNEYDTRIFEARVRRLVEKTIHLCRQHGPGNYPGIVINLLGDMVSGALHPELAKTDEEEVIPSVLRVRDVLVWALGAMADEFGKLYVPCTSGNHGRNTLKPQFKRTVYENFDWLIYQLVARHFEKDKRITFDIPESNEVHYQVFGLRFMALHGDMLGVKGGDGIVGVLGPIMRGETKVGKQASAMGRHYDVLLMGHYHQHIMLRRIIVAGTLKGWDEFAAKALRAPPAPPSQPLWFVEQRFGITQTMEVYVEDVQNVTSDEWIGWRASGRKPAAA